MTYTLLLLPHLGNFASNKDIARDLREQEILPRLAKNESVILDFDGIEGATQSLIHALIAEAFKIHGRKALELIEFKSVRPLIKTLISLVIDYSLLK